MNDPLEQQRKLEWTEEVAKTNFIAYKANKLAAGSWRANALKMEDARYGKQFSPAEEAAALTFRLAPMPISISTAICDSADALMISNKPTVYVAPKINPYNRSEETQKIANAVAQKYLYLIQNSWYNSLGNLQFDRMVNDQSNVGHGLGIVQPRNEGGQFTVDYNHLSWKYFYPDGACSDSLYRNSDINVVAIPMTWKQAYRYIRALEPNLSEDDFREHWLKGGVSEDIANFERDNTYGTGITPEQNPTLLIVSYALEHETLYKVYPTDKGAKGFNLENDVPFRTISKITEIYRKMEASGYVKLVPYTDIQLVERTSIGALGVTKVLPVKQHNIVPLVYDHRGTPYPYGRMWHIYPIQRMLNKTIMSTILNMSLNNSTRVLAEENSIINEANWITSSSLPGAILTYRLPNPSLSKPPMLIEAKPMSEAWLALPRWLIYMMEYVSGIYASTMMGDPSQTPDVFSTMAAAQSAGMFKIKRRMANADATLTVMAQLGAEFYKEYSPFNGYSSYIDLQGKEPIRMTTFNELDTREIVDPATGAKSFVPFIKPESDLHYGIQEVRFASRGGSGYESATEGMILTHLATQMSTPELMPFILKRMNMGDVEEISEAIDTRKKLAEGYGQAQETIKKMSSQIEENQKQITQLMANVGASRVTSKIKEELAKFQANPRKYLSDSYAELPINKGKQNAST